MFTHSPWEHTGIIIKDPWWVNKPLKGIYIYQSSSGPNSYNDILNGNNSGTTLNHISDFLRNRKHIYVKQLKYFDWDDSNKLIFEDAFGKSHSKPYDKNILHWIAAGINSFFVVRNVIV